MTEAEKKVGKTKISLIVSVALVVILVISNVWFYTNLQNQVQNQQQHYDELNSDFQNLNLDYDMLSTDFDDLQQDYYNLYSDHESLIEEHDDLQERYDTLEDSLKLLYTTTIVGGNVTWSFTTLDGASLKWYMPLDTYVYYASEPKPEEYHDLALDGQSITVRNMELFVEPEFFFEVIDSLTDGNSARDFVEEVFNLRVQLTLYSYDIVDTPQWSGETMTSGTGDCEDFAILMASLLLSGNEYAHYGMTVQMLYMDAYNPTNPQTVNHVMLYVTYEDDTKQFVDSTSTTVLSPWSRIVGWYYDL